MRAITNCVSHRNVAKNISDDVPIWGSVKEESVERYENTFENFDKYGPR